MSTPTPERVTLTKGEMEALLCDCDTTGLPDYCPLHTPTPFGLGFDLSTTARFIKDTVERILTAREQALREKIAKDIEAEAHPFLALADPDGHRATLHAARIARGG